MAYSPFGLNQLLDIESYRKFCQMMLEIPMDQETFTTLKSILFDGGYNDYGFTTGFSNKNNPWIEMTRRVGMAYLLLRNKDTFYYLANNQIGLFHGTNANALPSILKYGINNIKASEKAGIKVTTGEEWTRKVASGNFTSFTDVLDISEFYSCINSKQKNKSLSFPVVFGITKGVARESGVVTVHSDIPEIGINGSIQPGNIGVIMVPTDKIELVKKMAGDIPVLGLDGVNEKFYFIDDIMFETYDEKYKEFSYNVAHNIYPKSAELSGVSETVLGRLASRMKDKIAKLKELVGGDSNEHRNSK